MIQIVNVEDLKPVLSEVIHTNLQDTRRMALLLISYTEYVHRCNRAGEKPLDYHKWQDEAEKNKEFADLIPPEQAELNLREVPLIGLEDFKGIKKELIDMNLELARKSVGLLTVYCDYVNNCLEVNKTPLNYLDCHDAMEKEGTLRKEFGDITGDESTAEFKRLTFEALNLAILGTPTGELRNQLTNYVEKLMVL